MAATSDDMQMQPLDLSCPRRVQVTYSPKRFAIVTCSKLVKPNSVVLLFLVFF